MRETPCPVCTADAPYPAYELYDWLHGLDGPFCMVRCGRCGALYLSPRPEEEELARFYPASYVAYARPGLEEGPWLPRVVRLHGLEKRCRAVTRLRSGGRLLDVGCGNGDFLAQMRRHAGWEVEGLERNATAAAWAEERYGLQVHVGSVDALSLAPASYDVITLWDVLEHLPEPGASLRRMVAWLREGGWLVLRTPDAGSSYARFFGRYWAGLDAPRHLVALDRPSLNGLLRENGLQVERLWTLSGSHAMAVLSLRYWLRARGGRLGWSRLLEHPLAQVATWPFFWLLDRWGGAAVAAAARKTVAARATQAAPNPNKEATSA